MDQPNTAIELNEQALALYRQVGNRKGEANILEWLGAFNPRLGKSACALEYENQALTIYRETRDRSGEAHALRNIGAIYNLLSNIKEAYESTYAAVQIYDEIGIPEQTQRTGS